MKSPTEQRILERVLSGEWTLEHEEVRAHLALDPGARGRIEDSLAVAAGLDELGRDAHSAVEEAARLRGAPGEEAARDFVRARLGLDREREPAPAAPALARSRSGWVGVAIAAGVLLVVGLWLRDHAPAAGGEVLLGEPLAPLRPVGVVERYAPFVWDAAGSDAALFEVVVYDAGHAEVARSPRLSEPRWNPSADDWPDAILWEVLAFDAAGGALPSGSPASAERSR